MALDPSRLTAVADASFLIGVCKISHVPLLQRLFGQIAVAPAVWAEVVEQGAGKPGSDEIRRAAFVRQYPIVRLAQVDQLRKRLGVGEAETLVLAEELGCRLVLMDDLEARKTAQERDLHVMGVLGFLLEAKRTGHLDHISPLIESLMNQGFRFGPRLVAKVLHAAGEAGDPDAVS